MTSQNAKAELLVQWHQKDGSLLLPNAWDSASALLFERAGFPAIDTNSMGIAFAHGYPDGQQISREDMMQVIARIAAVVQVPVTADIEAGYGPTVEDVVKTIREVINAGVVGVNLEDNTGVFQPLYSVEHQVQRIAAARGEATQVDLSLVINARTTRICFTSARRQRAWRKQSSALEPIFRQRQIASLYLG